MGTYIYLSTPPPGKRFAFLVMCSHVFIKKNVYWVPSKSWGNMQLPLQGKACGIEMSKWLEDSHLATADFSDQQGLSLDHTSDTTVDATALLALGLLVTLVGGDLPYILRRW